MSIKSIIFDIGDVLVDFSWERHIRELGYPEETVTALGEGWIKTPLWDELDRGAISEREAIEHAKKALPGYEKEIEAFWSNPEGIVRCRAESKEWLASLKARGYNVYLLTNYPRSFFEHHSAHEFDFLDYVDGWVVSSHIGIMKPDRRIYETLMAKYSLEANECLFVDDRQPNIDGAAAVGINTLHFVTMRQAREDMERLLAEADNE